MTARVLTMSASDISDMAKSERESWLRGEGDQAQGPFS